MIVLEMGKEGAAPIRPELPASSTVPAADDGILQTADGAQILLSINLNALDEIDGIAATAAAGIGLMRSEFASRLTR